VSEWQIARHRVAIAGRVLDAGSSKPVADATVSMTVMPAAFEKKLAVGSSACGSAWKDMPQRPDRTKTRKDGLFYFLDLPDGKYSLRASKASYGKRYGVAEQSVEVSRDSQGNFKIAFVDLNLPPTTIKGKITGSGHKSGVVLAEVRVKGSGERTFSDVQGQYAVTGIESGKRVLLVSAQGYRTATENVTLAQPGASHTLNFSLNRE
jgi:hypothetical protein